MMWCLLYIIVIDIHTGKWWRAGTRHRKEPDALQWKLLFSFFSSWKWAVAAVLLHQFEGGSVYVYIYACPWISHKEDCHKSHCQIFYFYIPSPIQTQKGEGFYCGCPQLDSVSPWNNMETFSFFPMERTLSPSHRSIDWVNSRNAHFFLFCGNFFGCSRRIDD